MTAGKQAGNAKDPPSRWAGPVLAAFLALLVLLVVPGLEQPGRAARLALLIGCGPWAFLLAVGAGWRPGDRLPPPQAIVLACFPLLALVVGVVRFLPGPEAPAVLRDALPLAVLIAAGWAGLATFRRGPAAAARVLAPVAAGVLLAASLAGLAQAWLGWEGLPVVHPPAGPFVNRNVAAQALVPLLALLVPAAAVLHSIPGRVFLALASSSGAAFLLATRSRGGWVAAAVALVVGGIVARRAGAPPRDRRGGRLLLLALLAGGIAGALVPVRRIEPLPSVGRALALAASGEEGSLAVRRALRENTWAMARAHPVLGVGPGRFRVAYADWHAARLPTPGYGVEKRPAHAHCDPLEWAAELGFPAAVALLVLLGAGVLLAARFPAAGGEPAEVRAWRVAVAAGVTGLLVHSLASFPFHSPASAFLGFFLAGSSWGLAARGRDGAGGAGASVVRWARPLAAALLVVLGVAGGLTAVQLLAGQRALALALGAWSRGDCATAVEEAHRVFREEPWNRRDVGLAAGVLFRCDRSPSALPWLERAHALDPGSLVLALDTGARRLKAGRPGDALASYRRALAIRPDLARAWLGVAMASLRLGDEAGAREACRHALEAPADGARRAAEAFCRGNRLVE